MTTGMVVRFDEAAGLGVVVDDDGRERPFHCVEIVGGARTIATGVRIEFELQPKLGRWEATALRPLGG